MGLKIASLGKLACCLALILLASTPTVKSQTQDCNIQEIDIGLCLNQSDGSFSIDHSCCQMLNQAVQIGYSCLCLLAAASFPLAIPPLSLPLSNCSLSVPPLTPCQGGSTPSSPDHDKIIQAPARPINVPLSPPQVTREVNDHSNTTTDGNNSQRPETQPPSSGCAAVPELHLPNRQKQNGTSNSGTRRYMMMTSKSKLRRSLSLCLFLVVLLVITSPLG